MPLDTEPKVGGNGLRTIVEAAELAAPGRGTRRAAGETGPLIVGSTTHVTGRERA